MPPTKLERFLTDLRPPALPVSTIRTEFYKEEFLKHRRCLEQYREYYSEEAILQVEKALAKIISQVDTLSTKADADQVVSGLLRKFDVVTNLSAWTDPRNVH